MKTILRYCASLRGAKLDKSTNQLKLEIKGGGGGIFCKITNGQNTKRTYGQPSEQLFPKRWPSNPNRIKHNMNTHKVKRHRNIFIQIRHLC